MASVPRGAEVFPRGSIVTFRYRILPHGAYYAAAANRFGMEQAQPLAHVAANVNPALRPLVVLDNERVSVSILKPSADGKEVTLRLRSLSEKPETVQLAFPAGAPQAVHAGGAENLSSVKADDPVSLLPYGVVTLRLEF